MSDGRDATGRAARDLDVSPRTASLPESARCPHCGEEETEQFATFGSAVSTSQYYCRRCRSVFEYFKWR